MAWSRSVKICSVIKRAWEALQPELMLAGHASTTPYCSPWLRCPEHGIA